MARESLHIDWDDSAMHTFSTSQMMQQFREQAKSPGTSVRREGDPDAAFAQAAKKIEAVYEFPYLPHAMMEPLNCAVDLRADSCEIWTGTQFQTVDRANAAKIAGLPPEKVNIHTTMFPGGEIRGFLGQLAKDQCKNAGFGGLTNPATGEIFKNQGLCVSSVVSQAGR